MEMRISGYAWKKKGCETSLQRGNGSGQGDKKLVEMVATCATKIRKDPIRTGALTCSKRPRKKREPRTRMGVVGRIMGSTK